MGGSCLHSSRICSRASGEIPVCFEAVLCFLQFLLQSWRWFVAVHGIAFFFKGIIFRGSVMVSVVTSGNAACCKGSALLYFMYSIPFSLEDLYLLLSPPCDSSMPMVVL